MTAHEATRISTSEFLKDFYLSFRFSQADIPLQQSLYDALRDNYLTRGFDPNNHETLENVRVASFKLQTPTGHQKIEDGARRHEFGEQLKVYVHKLQGDPEPIVVQYRHIIGKLIAKDIDYQKRSRRSLPEDPHQSFFRQYVLIGEDTGSEAFNTVFYNAKNIWHEPETQYLRTGPQGMAVLESAWEENHAPQSFFVDGADSAYDNCLEA